MEAIDFSTYPPTPVVWAYTAVDSACEPLGCTDWRDRLPHRWSQEGAWLSGEFKIVRSMSELKPPLLTYQQYLQQEYNDNGQGQIRSSIGLKSLYNYAFKTSSTSLAELTTPTAICALFMLVIVLRRIKAILLPRFSDLGRQAALHTHGRQWLEQTNNQTRIVKFGEYVFRLIFHTAVSIAGIVYFWDKEWWKADGTKSLWIGYPNQPIDAGMAWYYLAQSAYNVEAMISLLEISFVIKTATKGKFPGFHIEWSPNVRGDFREMFVHHVITNMLILGSSSFRVTRAGSMVFLVHDISDIPVDLSKLANFLKWKASTAVCFTAMVVLWCITRLSILPFVIFKSVMIESWMVCANGVVDPILYVFYQPIFVFLIGLLILLHAAWFTMFLQMGYYLVFKGEAHDLSEHKTGETLGTATKRKIN
ncbi:unnamed protein product [Cylindrotheca closterium]|uniref:TLC domain-containing protein n=1 Tax=Cylindrotheca closterium TaxID=2856 RepID=A0AAD2CJX2_9STRA|nr:unnamed protein product [Cylindrotheca closterium]